MANSAEFVAHCLDLLAPGGQVRARRMFGGHGVYLDDLFIALVVDETLYLKADDSSRSQFEQGGCQPFRYRTQDQRTVSLDYWSAPGEAMESPGLMRPWARLAQASALRSAAAKRGPRKSPRTGRPDRR